MRTPLSDPLGEEALIQEFLAPLAAGTPGAEGLRDDCAVLAPPAGMDLVLKTDPIREGVHFFSDDDPADIGWKALAVNVSDLAAKGAAPLVYLLALSFPAYPTRLWMAGFARGLGEAQRAFGCMLTGGDTDRAAGPISIAVTVVGAVAAGQRVSRTTARAGDALYVSGTIGCAALGLALRRGDQPMAMLTDEERTALLKRYLRPAPRLALADAVRRYASASMDVSDGLVKDAARLCHASGVGGSVELARVPLGQASRRLVGADPTWALQLATAGDDYEILCSVPAADATSFESTAYNAGVPVTRIGSLMAGAGLTVLGLDGRPLAIDRAGWDHFA